ncbi:MAG: hypothetical protein PHE78_08420 [Candidatus Gastranaerophilales bacterium]|nr:hypothetical protein [Candidatus Gastranaerophilales bacterium]
MEEKSLAQFVQQKRDKLGFSPSGLAKRCNLELALIERIEAGEELFLPTTIRQNLAKGLKCSLDEIKVLEKDFENRFADEETIRVMKQKILNGENNLICPKCGSLLNTRIAKMYDLEDNLMLHPKAHCIKCVFQIKD